MLEEEKEAITKNFVELVKLDINDLTKKLVDLKIFNQNDINYCLESEDDRHNRRLLLFELQKKDTPQAFKALIDYVTECERFDLKEKLENTHAGAVMFREPNYGAVPMSPCVLKNSFNEKLVIKVIHSSQFYDTIERNKDVQFYQTRSINRGRVLIINNYKFEQDQHNNRNGADVDQKNLISLFEQIGFQVEPHENKTAPEMRKIIKKFASVENGNVWDTCFAVIMSHGTGVANESYVFGVDGGRIATNAIQNDFNNENAPLLRGKPKVFLYQICRGQERDTTVLQSRTATDSNIFKFDNIEETPHLRTYEDMLIGHATLQGFVAHRDYYRGTWYMEQICEVFMNHAHDYTVVELLQIVDDRLSKKMSEKKSMQTSEQTNRGFKKLYLHPGIYMEDGEIKKIREDL